MKFLFDLFPILLFFVAYKFQGIYVATAVAIGASVLQVAWFWWRHRRVEMMHVITLVLIVVLGGATLWLHDELFIKWKPTVLYWMFASVLSVSALFFRKNLIRSMLGEQIQLPDPAWNKLNYSWAGFFAGMGFLNLYVAFNFPTDIWVDFKLFGGMGLMLAFVIAQGLFLAKYVEPKESE